MGLTAASTGQRIAREPDAKRLAGDKIIALAGNPNVGKSTVYNALTGMRQHTGNWPGKTVGSAQGIHTYRGKRYVLVDIPGVYSLMAHSAEEEIARDFICFGEADATVVICDATCLARNMNLVLQTLEITDRVIVCINLMDEAKRRQLSIDCEALSRSLGVPVVAAAAGRGQGIESLSRAIRALTEGETETRPVQVAYRPEIEEAIALLVPQLTPLLHNKLNPRWVALRLLEKEEGLAAAMTNHLGFSPAEHPALAEPLAAAREKLTALEAEGLRLHDALVSDIYKTAEDICKTAVTAKQGDYSKKQIRIDRFLTNRLTGLPCMLLLLLAVLWMTIQGANYPSSLLSDLLFGFEDEISGVLSGLGTPVFLHDALVYGVYRVLAWVVAVMLPPMAIFFPLFTLLEDLGYLPRIAFNLDHVFKKCRACGKQALTMCKGKSMVFIFRSL